MVSLDFASLRQLRAFATAAELQSISKAAQELNLSQPCVTQSIGRLETQLKVTLFERRRTGSYVTELGAVLLPRVRRFFDHIRSALCDPLVGTPFVERQFARTLESKLTASQIRSLIAISESSSLDGAARKLGLAQPSLQRSARELERVLRRSLYHRTARGFTTSPQGSELARRFKVALREIEYGIEELQAAQGVFTSRIVLGNIPHSETHMLSAAINDLLTRYPHAKVQVLDGHYDALLDDLRTGKIDILFGILRRPAWAVDVEEEPLFNNPYAVVARRGHPLTRLRTITLRDLESWTWIMPGAGAPRRQALERVFEGLKRPPTISVETTSRDLYRNLLATSDHISLISRIEVDFDANTELRVLPFRSHHLNRMHGIATRADWKPTGMHLEFVNLLRTQASTRFRGAA